MKKIFLHFVLLLAILVPSSTLQAQEVENAAHVYFFHAHGCPHCAAEIEFLGELAKEVLIKIYDYELTKNRENLKLLHSLEKILDQKIPGTPFTIVGETTISGFLSGETTGKKVREAVGRVLAGEEIEVLKSSVTKEGDGMFKKEEVEVKMVEKGKERSSTNEDTKKIPETIDLPLFGTIQTKYVSLPVLTFVIALLDGFNPCAMWVLVFLISLLLGMKDRKRMWILGSTFILASGFVYFLIMTAWLNVLLLLGFVFWIRLAIGLLALGAGGWYLYDAATNPTGQCKVSHGGNKQKVFARLKQFAQHPNLWIALGGIILLAFAVNVVEAVCSAGLPVVFNEIMILSNLETWQYYAYLAFYILIFMLDDLVVFGIAMTTLRYANIDTKYARYSHIIGGILMLILGGLLIFKPELLMFG